MYTGAMEHLQLCATVTHTVYEANRNKPYQYVLDVTSNLLLTSCQGFKLVRKQQHPSLPCKAAEFTVA